MMKVDVSIVLKQLLASYNVPVHVINEKLDNMEDMDFGFRKRIDKDFNWEYAVNKTLKYMNEATLYVSEDMLGALFAFIKVSNEDNLFISIGPFRYVDSYFDESKVVNFTEEQKNYAKDYFFSLPFINREVIDVVVTSIISSLYTSQQFELKYIKEFTPLNFTPNTAFFDDAERDFSETMEMIAYRYEVEKACLEAITLGNAGKAKNTLRGMMNSGIVNRYLTSIREQRNGLIILNTLFRKAIEKANVHPFYIDEISARFAKKIELINNQKDQYKLLDVMINEYCAYVQKYSLTQYSPTIQKTINYIHIYISEPLSLSIISHALKINSSYLSRIFKEEMNMTITEYINMQKIQKAKDFILQTDLSLSLIGERVGIVDMNYFSRLFKKYVGLTPTEYKKLNK